MTLDIINMDYLTPTAPSVGKITNQILAINPALNTSQIISIVRQCMVRTGRDGQDFGALEIVDEARALELARFTLPNPNRTRSEG